MMRYRPLFFMLCISLILSAIVAGNFLWQSFYVREFSCHANFVQHHSNETLYLWLNYRFSGGGGMLSMNGYAQSDPAKKFNRKISFSVQRYNNIYHLRSEKNIKFPDDNVDNSWLEKYEPAFFVHPQQNIYIRIREQLNGSYLFIFSTLPAYICSSQ